jgi:hypothetical protein
MKTKLIFFLLLIVCFSCGTNNKPVSDAQKDMIKGQIKEIVNTGFKGCEEVNFDMATRLFLDSPDFIFINNDNSSDYKQFMDAVKQAFGTLINQTITVTEEKYVFLDKSKVIYTTKGKCLANYKDGHAILSEPMITQFTFEKINNKWEAINLVQTSVDKTVKNTETSKELNQVKLMNQFLGTWKGEMGKDTTYIGEIKLFGTGMLSNVKTVTKGKTIIEGQTIIGYDSKSDKFIESELFKGTDIILMTIWFTSKNSCVEIPYEYLLNPENAPVKWQYEFKSSDLMVWNYIENNKTTKSFTFHREK